MKLKKKRIFIEILPMLIHEHCFRTFISLKSLKLQPSPLFG